MSMHRLRLTVPGPSEGIVLRVYSTSSPTLLPSQILKKVSSTSAGEFSPPPSVSPWQRAHCVLYAVRPRSTCSLLNTPSRADADVCAGVAGAAAVTIDSVNAAAIGPEPE